MNKRLLTSTLLGSLLMVNMANAQTCTTAAIAESTPTSGFTFSTDGKTATHTAMGLMWKRCLEGQAFSDNGTSDDYLDDTCTGSAPRMNWKAALNQAQTANSANDSGYNDWRVPNSKELGSIVEYCRRRPAINTDVFRDFPTLDSVRVWSSSPETYPDTLVGAWGANFAYGSASWYQRSDTNRVRLVRSVTD